MKNADESEFHKSAKIHGGTNCGTLKVGWITPIDCYNTYVHMYYVQYNLPGKSTS